MDVSSSYSCASPCLLFYVDVPPILSGRLTERERLKIGVMRIGVCANVCKCCIFIYSMTIGLIFFLLASFMISLAMYRMMHPARYAFLSNKLTPIQHPKRKKTKWLEGLLNFAVYHMHLAVWQ